MRTLSVPQQERYGINRLSCLLISPKVRQGKFMQAVSLPDLSRRDLKSISKVLKTTCSPTQLDPKDGVCL